MLSFQQGDAGSKKANAHAVEACRQNVQQHVKGQPQPWAAGYYMADIATVHIVVDTVVGN